MDKIYMDAKDKNVAKVVIYVDDKDAGRQPYVDEACTIKCSDDELHDAFEKGTIVYFMRDGNVDLETVPLAFSSHSGVSALLVTLGNDSSPFVYIPTPIK